MAGHRLNRKNGSFTAQRVAGWRDRYAEASARADTPGKRIGAASDLLRLALKYAPAERVDRITSQAVVSLTDLAEELLTSAEQEHQS